MDFKEYLIKKERTGSEIILTVLLYLLAAALSVVAMFVMPSLGPFGGIATLLMLGLFYGAFFLSSKFKKEFEYIQTEEYFDVDVIFNKSRRKRLASLSLKSIEIMANIKDENHCHILKEQFEKVIDATTGRKDAEVYFIVFNKNGRVLLKIEPPAELVKEMHRYAPFKIHLKKD